MKLAWLAGASLLLTACQGVPGDGRRTERAPSRDTFAPTGEVLANRCGTLDCHGQTSRNFRLYSQNGLRLSGDNVSGQGATTDAEQADNYEAVISIEPDILAAVVKEHDNPDRLTIVRKARGAEHHKGNTIFEVGDDADTCFTTWLTTSKVDEAACTKGADLISPFESP